jgi:hypothetical protein
MKTVGPPYSGKLNVRWDEKGMIGLCIELNHSFTLDMVFTFERQDEARRFYEVLPKRLALSAKNCKKIFNLQHISHSRYDATAEFRIKQIVE